MKLSRDEITYEAWKRAQGRDFKQSSPNEFKVRSTRFPLNYTVKVNGDMLDCNCCATSCCWHLALIASHVFPVSVGFKFECQDTKEFLEFRHRINIGAPLTRSERIKLICAMRAREAVMPSERKQAA